MPVTLGGRLAGLAAACVLGIAGLTAVLEADPAVAAVGTSPFWRCTVQAAARVASQPQLTGIRNGKASVPGSPFGVVATRAGRWSFISGSLGTGLHAVNSHSYVAVMADRGFVPRLVRVVHLPISGAAGSVLTPDGRYLLVAAGTGAVVLSVARLEKDERDPVLGALKAPIIVGGTATESAVAIEVIASKDGHFVFVSEEGPGEIAVFNLRRALATRFASSGYEGKIQLGRGVVGMALSPDGATLYATSERTAVPYVSPEQPGKLSVIDVATAETYPKKAAVISAVAAGCSPVRVAVSPDAQTVWVTARGSNQLLAFSAQKLVSDPAHSLLTSVQVGEQPVGLVLFDHGQRIALADSDRGDVPGRRSGLTIVNTTAALDGSSSLIGELPAGSFPRELAVEPSQQVLLVTNYASGQLEAVDLQHVS